MTYPTDLIAKAEFELHVFERVSADTGIELIAEVKAWREMFPEVQLQPKEKEKQND